MKTALLLGGSFNPIHPAHLETLSHLHGYLKTDEVWLLFSDNPDKNPADYAPLNHRMEMAKIMARHYAHLPLVTSDFESTLPSHQTDFVLHELQTAYPDYKFIWVMGADCLVDFHKWDNYQNIARNHSMAIIDRAPYGEAARKSVAAKEFAHLQKEKAEDICSTQAGWMFFPAPNLAHMSYQSKYIRQRLACGDCNFTDIFNDVACYCKEHHLYIPATAQNPPQQKISPAP